MDEKTERKLTVALELEKLIERVHSGETTGLVIIECQINRQSNTIMAELSNEPVGERMIALTEMARARIVAKILELTTTREGPLRRYDDY